MMSNSTPGPWSLAWEDGKYGVVGSTTEGKLVCLVGNNPDDGKNDERKANATLIAAAPTMYEYVLRKAKEGDTDAAKIIDSIV